MHNNATRSKGCRPDAGIHFVDCSGNAIYQETALPGGHRRQVVVAGRQVKTVDVHAHCVIPEALALMPGARMPEGKAGGIVVAEERVRQMDEQGIDVEALSINPFWYEAGSDLADAICRLQNEKLAELCGRSERFVAFATVAIQFPELAVEQLQSAVKKFGFRGVSLGTHVNESELADSRFHPFWRKVEELGVLVFMHPLFSGVTELKRRLAGGGHLRNVIGNPLDTTIALSHLIFEGTFDRFPGVKLCCAHGGGYLPSYAHRSDHGFRITSEPGNYVKLAKRPTEYLRQLYFDSLVFTPEALRHLVAEVGAGQVMLGTDHPYPWQSEGVDHVLATPELTDEQRRAILGETACQLLGIPE